jgi:hypothetical protein
MLHARWTLFAGAALLGAGCTPIDPVAEEGDSDLTVSLPTITAPPKPYDPKKDRPFPKMTFAPVPPSASADAFRQRTERLRQRLGTKASLPAGDNVGGLNIFAGQGIFTGSDTQRNLEPGAVPPPPHPGIVYVYAPTNMPNGSACLESVTIHSRERFQESKHLWALWNHCITPGNWLFQPEQMTAAWRRRHARTFRGEEVYYSEVHRNDTPTGPVWEGSLFNFETQQWDPKGSFAGTNTIFPNGWTQWESHFMVGCDPKPSVRANDVQILTNSGWKPLTFPVSQLVLLGECFEGANPPYTVEILSVSDATDWRANTPNP